MTAAADMRTVRNETKAAREALEAKRAFKPENAAAHLVLALEALLRACGTDRQLDLEDTFLTAYTGH